MNPSERLAENKKKFKSKSFSLIMVKAAFLLLFIFSIIWSIYKWSDTVNHFGIYQLLFAIICILIGIGIASIDWIIFKKIDNKELEIKKLKKQISTLTKGNKGEELFLQHLKKHFRADYKILRNVDMGEGQGDIDFLMIGPRGIFVIEVKNFGGKITLDDENITCKFSNKTYYHTTRQIFNNVEFVKDMLEKGGLKNSYITPVFAFVNNPVKEQKHHEHLFVIKGREKIDHALEYLKKGKEPLTKDYCQKIVEIFKPISIEVSD